MYAADPSSYWRLDDADGSTTLKDAGQNEVGANVGRNVRFGQAGALSGPVGQAAAFSDSIAVSQQRISNPTTYSLEM